MQKLKFTVIVSILAATSIARADCPSTLPLKGFSSVDSCAEGSANCVSADEALYAYSQALPDNDPASLTITMHGSPWHVYGPDYHIIDIEELAGMVRRQGAAIKHVTLISSWSAVAPDKNSKSIAQRLSVALKGMPVKGQNGFVWFNKTGSTQTTHQAFTGVISGPYRIRKGGKVMASLVAGWPHQGEAEFAKKRDAVGLMRAGAALDIFMLCPERALKAFDASAALANPIAAYNAAIMRLERGAPGDALAATTLLKQAAAAGDKPAQAKLLSLGAPAR